MRKLCFVLLLSGSFLLAQHRNPSATSQHKPKCLYAENADAPVSFVAAKGS